MYSIFDTRGTMRRILEGEDLGTVIAHGSGDRLA